MNTNSSHTLPINKKGGNTSQLILLGQYHLHTKSRQRYDKTTNNHIFMNRDIRILNRGFLVVQ